MEANSFISNNTNPENANFALEYKFRFFWVVTLGVIVTELCIFYTYSTYNVLSELQLLASHKPSDLKFLRTLERRKRISSIDYSLK